MEKTYTWVEEREVATNGVSNDRRDGFERSKKSSWDNNRGQKNKDRFSPYRGPNHGLLPSLSKSPKEILATEKAARSFEPPPKMFGSKRSRDTSKYCHFHEDYGHDTNDCRHLRCQIQEAENSGQLSHLVKGIKKERTKSSDTTRGEVKRIKALHPLKRPYLCGSSCEIIYEHCFKKLNPAIKATRVDLKTPLVGFSRECSWSVGEVLLEIKIGDAPLSRTETLNFIIVRSDSSHNMLLGRTAMQRMGIVVSTIHGAIKFHTEKGIGTVFLTNEADEGAKRDKKIPATNKERIFSCVNDEENIILQNLLKSNANVFAWTQADMTGILRTITVKGKPFNTEHKLNEYSHIKPIKQNKRGLGPDRNMVACKETEELTKAGILRKVKHQTRVANPVMVKKSDGEWRMCVDFTDINKLNPKKCSFEVEEGPFLGHLITKHGIKANPSKVKAVTNLDQPRTLKDIQSLNGKLAALSQFLSKGAERSLAFFKVLKGCKDKKSIQWTTEADKALEKIKKLVQSLPTLTAPKMGETLTMHLAASKESISVVLAAKRNEGWTPIYFKTSNAYTITVLTNTPIKQIPTGPKKTRRVAKWAIELGEHDIVFLRREEKETSADFLVEIPSEDNEKKEKPKEVPDSSRKEYTYALRFEFETTNNEAEYEALLAGLRIAQEMEITKAVKNVVENESHFSLKIVDQDLSSLAMFTKHLMGEQRKRVVRSQWWKRVGEGKVESMGGIRGGSFAKRSMVAKDGLGGDGFVVDGGRSPSKSRKDGGLENKSSMGSRLIVTGELIVILIGYSGGVVIREVGGAPDM
ncbi:reverse transcriptase domain-containing protein [Tanacetum coccineum]